MREDARRAGRSRPKAPDPGNFLAASTDGSMVLFQNGRLHSLGAGEPTVDLTAGKGGFQGILGQSEDLSHIYFIDTAVLDETPNEEGEEAEATKANLYAWREGTTRFLATLLPADNEGKGGILSSSDWESSPGSRTAEASPDGHWLAFLSTARLTGYDNTGPCIPDHAGGFVAGPCPQVFLYRLATGKLRCASCNQSGAAPLGSSVLRLIQAGQAPASPAT